MTENQRIKIIINELSLTQKALAEALGMQQGSLSDVIREKNGVKVSDSIKFKLENLYNISRKWLETGEGEMLVKSKETSHEDAKPTVINAPTKSAVPIYDVAFTAGMLLNLIELRNQHEPSGWLDWPEIRGCDAIIKVSGDSMEPRIPEGSYVAIKKQENWQEWLPLNQVYAISTDSHLVVKYITAQDDKLFMLESHNQFYKPEPQPKKYIRDLWAVKAILPFGLIKIL